MKKDIPRSALPLLLGLLLTHYACRKDPEPVVEGRVLEYGTNTPIPDAKVVLDACGGTLLGPISCATIATTQSAADGSYSMPKDKSAGALVANASKIGYFTDDESQIGGLDKPINDIYLKPHAWIKATIKNLSGKYGFASFQLLGGKIQQSLGDESIFKIMVKGNIEYRLFFSVMLDESSTYKSDIGVFVFDKNNAPLPFIVGSQYQVSLSTIGHDTTNITIIY
ncbi:MAG: hypothetical protein RIR11_4826 [Bacteroidota bacterium]|jgi:hypothetical protein